MLKKDFLKKIMPPKDVSFLKKLGFWIVSTFLGLFLLGIIAVAGLIAVLSIGLPDVDKLEDLNAAQSTQILDREGNLLYTIHGEENREQVALDDISKQLIDATIAFEDSDFWNHGGFDIWALGKVGMYEVFGIGKPRGGSTITQQYIKNTFLSPERSYIRKAKELILAIRLERNFSKEEILELYLNRIPYGNNAYGIQKAAEVYFGKNAKDLTIGESAILVALPQAPSRYNPYGDNKYSHLLKEFTLEELEDREIKTESDLKTEEYARGLIGKHIDLADGNDLYIPGRSDIVLKRLYDIKVITAEERKSALNEIQSIQFNKYVEPIKHPHFVFYIRDILEDKYGPEFIQQGGLKVYTTIDPELQDFAEKVALEKGELNEKTYQSNNVAILTINAKTGEILAMVGSRDYWNDEIEGKNNLVLSPRQPGSAFKPIVYSQAFYNGYAPGSVIYDVPTKIGPDRPQNFDGKFQGQLTMRRALGQSRNIPAIKTYFLAGEQDPIIDLAEKMGITTLDKSHSYGYPLALGAAEIPLIEMVKAYAVFANNGKRPEINGILRIENANGDILEELGPKEFEEVMDPQIAYLINSILSDESVSIGPKLFVPGKIVASKTGTSTKENKKAKAGQQVRPSDLWTIGYTPTIVTGVWNGNTNGDGLGFNAAGYQEVAPIFQAVMTKALEDMPAEPFPEPQGIKKVQISKASGKLPGPETPSDMIITELFASFSVPTETEKLFYRVKIDKISGLLATEFTPEDAVENVLFQNYEPIADLFNWAQEIREYYKNQEGQSGNTRIGVPPTEFDNIHNAETAKKKPEINIISPPPQSLLPIGSSKIEVQVSAQNGVSAVEFYLNEDKKFTASQIPYGGFINIPRYFQDGSVHLVTAKVIDKLGYSAKSAIEIKVIKGLNSNEEPPSPQNPS